VFHDISANMREVMRALEEQLERDQRSLRSVDTDVGRVLSLLAMSAPRGEFLELGSSGGYSSLWLSLAARAKGVTLITVDLDEKKVALARENISRAGAGNSVQSFTAMLSTMRLASRRSRFVSPILSPRSSTLRSTRR
jgi:caffeoyl-CoA O-methyltransferase